MKEDIFAPSSFGLKSIRGPVQLDTIPIKEASTLAPSDTTPEVYMNEYWICANTGAVSVTNFTKYTRNQRLHLLGDGNTTVVNGSTIRTNTGANKLLAANKVYVFTNFNNVWYEDA